jgi:hypothetical protein
VSTVTASVLQEQLREEKVREAFDVFMDHAVFQLGSRGLDSTTALMTLFTVADALAEEGALPWFPDDQASYVELGEWLVAASDFDFVSFVLEAVGE